jgi:hypothetical protein
VLLPVSHAYGCLIQLGCVSKVCPTRAPEPKLQRRRSAFYTFICNPLQLKTVISLDPAVGTSLSGGWGVFDALPAPCSPARRCSTARLLPPLGRPAGVRTRGCRPPRMAPSPSAPATLAAWCSAGAPHRACSSYPQSSAQVSGGAKATRLRGQRHAAATASPGGPTPQAATASPPAAAQATTPA